MGKRIWPLGLAVCLTAAACGQTLLSSDGAALMERRFSEFKADTLNCSVPAAFQGAGYSVVVHFRDLSHESGKLLALTRVTPKGQTPSILAGTHKIPKPPGDMRVHRFDLRVFGTFRLGPGKYRVEWLLIADDHRSCRRKWVVDMSEPQGRSWLTGPSSPDRLRPGEVASARSSSGIFNWKGKLDRGDCGFPVTVLLNVNAWNFPWATRVAIANLVAPLPCLSVHLVAFSLDQRREIWRPEHFGAADFSTLDEILEDRAYFATITAEELARRSVQSYLAGLLEQELEAKERSRVILWLSAPARNHETPRKEVLPQLQPCHPRLVYFQYPQGGNSAASRDSIHRLVKALEGKVFVVETPDDLHQATQELLKDIQDEGCQATPPH
jgi:hypothetical protein